MRLLPYQSGSNTHPSDSASSLDRCIRGQTITLDTIDTAPELAQQLRSMGMVEGSTLKVRRPKSPCLVEIVSPIARPVVIGLRSRDAARIRVRAIDDDPSPRAPHAELNNG